MRLMLSDHMTHEIGMGIVGQLKQRVVVMKAHRKDKARSMAKELRKMRDYLKEPQRRIKKAATAVDRPAAVFVG